MNAGPSRSYRGQEILEDRMRCILSDTGLFTVTEPYPSTLSLRIRVVRIDLLTVVWRISEADENSLIRLDGTGSTPLFDEPPAHQAYEARGLSIRALQCVGEIHLQPPIGKCAPGGSYLLRQSQVSDRVWANENLEPEEISGKLGCTTGNGSGSASLLHES